MAWGSEVPEWILVLARSCDQLSRNRVAKLLGYSPSVVSQVLNNNYQAGLELVEKRVRGTLLQETLTCPVAGTITLRVCGDNQKKAQHFSAASPMRIKISKMCRSGKCPHSRIGGSHV